MSAQGGTFEFDVEARQLLQLMIHSIYSNKEIFLRELISNASDALDKLRIRSLTENDVDADISDLHIRLDPDPQQRTLTVSDNGIGMTYDEVVQLIGTIAKSDTAQFLERMKQSDDPSLAQDLIGSFGVGFYSSFMVADEVTLVTRHAAESQGTRWQSSGEGSYTIEPVDDAPQGTSVTLHLKPEDTEDQLHDYTSSAKITEIVKRYSDFIRWPIRMAVEQTDSDGETTSEIETINSMKALWTRSRQDITEDEYNEFYKLVSHDWADPLETIHVQAEGTFEYQALLFLPSQAPMDLFMRERKRGVQLYVKRVFIMDDCEELVPEYLRFVKGVVDAQDLSLNVSRENLQQDRQIQMMRRRLVKKVLSTVKDMMSESPQKYRTFWNQFGRALKEGLVNDPENRDSILEISSFSSTNSTEELTTLREYVDRMPEGQQNIYYMTGDSRASIENSPHMEAFREKGLEVLVLTEPVDEVWVETVPEFDGKKFQSIAKGEVDLDAQGDGGSKDEDFEKRKGEFAELLSWMTTKLDDKVKKVRLSTRLTNSPACIVRDSDDITSSLASMYRAMGQEIPQSKGILELNPTHPLVSGLQRSYGERGDDTELVETTELIHDMAMLAEGEEPSDRSRFTRLMADRLQRTL
ncbi:molecular chaperone HtpG [Haloactinospora alba]|uniref:Chaperone protein HtpG n=1 Tax=Haloactinospora alba TaxID=405555 RepID=A0A543NND0_9ACTN|nr:molecular chaperone HtpG [Haloactinospora alba]TQN33340.1 molecular chaperone HtpG [Haloactinospora alba]